MRVVWKTDTHKFYLFGQDISALLIKKFSLKEGFFSRYFVEFNSLNLENLCSGVNERAQFHADS